MATSRSEDLPDPVLVAAAALPCAFWTATGDAFNLPKLLVAAAAALAGLALRSGGPTRLDGAALVFAGAFLLCAAVSIAPPLSWHGLYREYLFGAAGLAALLSAFWLGAGQRPERVIRWTLAGAVPVGAYALAQKAFGDPWVDIEGLGGRVASSLGDPVALGAYAALVLPLALAVRGRLGLAAGALALPALAWSGARGSWLAAAVGCGLAALFARGGSAARWAAAAALAAALAVPVAGRRAGVLPGADAARRELWRSAWLEFRQRPWLGSGPDALVVGLRRRKSEETARIYSLAGGQSHAHNDWLQVLATMGLAGGAGYAFLHARALREGARILEGAGAERKAILAALAGLLVHAKFNSPGLAPAWLASALAGSAFAARSEALPRAARRAAFAVCALWLAFSAVRTFAADRADRTGRHGLAVRIAPENTAFRSRLVRALLDGGRAKAASEAAYAGTVAAPWDADSYRLLAVAEIERGRLAPARLALEASDRLDPTYAATLRQSVRAAALAGDRDAQALYQRRLDRLTRKGE